MVMYTTLLLGFSTLAAVVLMARTVQTLRRHRYRAKEHLDSEYPSVSVCIAARNETHALAQCLERVLKSDYPKLEILVLDDSSTDDTSLIIKSFASAGVRFIPGAALPSGWLGKNHAYQTLIDEARGDGVHSDSGRPRLRQGAGEADEGGLGGDVVGVAEVAERGS